MRYKTPDALRDALDQHLRNDERDTGVPIARLRKRVAFERLLARLARAEGHWVLKGAFALQLRVGPRARATKDIDLAFGEGEAAAAERLNLAAALPLDDFFSYRIRRTDRLDNIPGANTVRYTVIAELGGRRFEQFPLDVAMQELPAIDPDSLEASNTLAFAGVTGSMLPVVAVEQHVAEKVHAYTRMHGPTGRPSTRVKDLTDLVLIAETTTLDAAQLEIALDVTYERRDQQALPTYLPSPPTAWAASYAIQAHEVDVPADLSTAHARSAELVDPVLGRAAAGRWDPTTRRWRSG